MREINLVEFSPQDRDDTLKAIERCKELMKDNEFVGLLPSANLIHTECLHILSRQGFRFSYIYEVECFVKD